jgi:hypothetical protein
VQDTSLGPNVNDVFGSGPDHLEQPGADDSAFTLAVAEALTAMAMRSCRHQADLMAALRGAGLPLERRRIDAALRRLVFEGKVSKVLRLADGGMLVSVSPSRPDAWGIWPTLSDW